MVRSQTGRGATNLAKSPPNERLRTRIWLLHSVTYHDGLLVSQQLEASHGTVYEPPYRAVAEWVDGRKLGRARAFPSSQ